MARMLCHCIQWPLILLSGSILTLWVDCGEQWATTFPNNPLLSPRDRELLIFNFIGCSVPLRCIVLQVTAAGGGGSAVSPLDTEEPLLGAEGGERTASGLSLARSVGGTCAAGAVAGVLGLGGGRRPAQWHGFVNLIPPCAPRKSKPKIELPCLGSQSLGFCMASGLDRILQELMQGREKFHAIVGEIYLYMGKFLQIWICSSPVESCSRARIC